MKENKAIIKTRKYLMVAAGLATIAMTASSCGYRGNQSGKHWFLDMADSPAIEAQEEDHTTLIYTKDGDLMKGAGVNDAFGGPGSGIRVPPANTVPRGYTPYLIKDQSGAKGLKNPVEKTKLSLERGQKQYNINCAVCHGYKGGGNGPIYPRFPLTIPNLVDGPAAKWADGEIFHLITRGRGAMGAYAAQIRPEDRWKIVQYIRLLQKTEGK